MTYKAVIFDLDGTLVNSIEDLADAMNTVLEKHNYPIHTYKTYQTLVGSGIRSLVANALPETQRNEAQINNCFDAMLSYYSKHCINKTKPYDGIIELLNNLKSRSIKLGVFSNKADALTKKVVAALLPNYFEPVLGLKEEAKKKPNPVVALEICQSLNVLPKETIFVGDTGIDIQTAKNAHMFPVGVTWGFRSEKELVDHEAKYILNDPLDLICIL